MPLWDNMSLLRKSKEHNEPISVEKLVRITGLSKGSVEDKINKLDRKGYIQKFEQGTGYLSNMSGSNLKNMKIPTIKHLMDDNDS
jgi:biotin operon repressor